MEYPLNETVKENEFMVLPGKSEIDVRVAEFIKNHKDDKIESSQSQNFWIDFFKIFGRSIRPDAQFERHMREDIAITPEPSKSMDLFWDNTLLIEQKGAESDVSAAVKQGFEYYYNILYHKKPRYVLGCNFKTFHLFEPTGKENWKFNIEDLPNQLGRFEFMRIGGNEPAGVETPVNLEATEQMGMIYDWLNENECDPNEIQIILVRLAYCFFADDTGLFRQKNVFHRWFGETDVTGKGAGLHLNRLFEMLNTKINDRPIIAKKEFVDFPYVNGGLFAERINSFDMDNTIRQKILKVSAFDWSAISPAIFGNLFQGLMNPKTRHDLGAHYTSKDNIMKVIYPLFLRKLWDEFDDIKSGSNKHEALGEFQERLSKLCFFDPACGSGNFLIVAYEQLRELELDILNEMWSKVPESERPSVTDMSKIKVENFYGIEIHPFAARIAQTSIWMMDHLMNKKLSAEFGHVYTRLPLTEIKNIHQGDALEMDWNKVLDSSRCSYIFGNPPFGGSKNIQPEQREQLQKIAEKYNMGGTMDYVSGWFVKAGEYVGDHTQVGFVATTGISQGEQVYQIWPTLFDLGFEIVFAYEGFKWNSEARKKAQVHVVIFGLSKKPRPGKRRIFRYEDNSLVSDGFDYINPYIIGSKKRLPMVKETSRQINGLRDMKMGSKPIDDGNFIFNTDEEKTEFLKSEPGAAKYIKPYVTAENYISGKTRWILSLHGANPNELAKCPEIQKRVELVRKYRQTSPDEGTRNLDPKFYHLNVIPTNPFLIIPLHTSSNRDYVPVGFLEPPNIPSNATMIIEDATHTLFGLITSKMHMLWLDLVGGKIRTDYRYSKGMVYNTFPVPDGWKDNEKLTQAANKVLAERKKHTSTLEDLYNPTLMPRTLHKAHEQLDKTVDGLYDKNGFKSDQERIEFLLGKYEEMINHA